MRLRLLATLSAFVPAVALAQSTVEIECSSMRFVVGQESYCTVGLVTEDSAPLVELPEYDSVRLSLTPLNEAEPSIDTTVATEQNSVTIIPVQPMKAGKYMLDLHAYNGSAEVASSRSIIVVETPRNPYDKVVAAGILAILLAFAALGVRKAL